MVHYSGVNLKEVKVYSTVALGSIALLCTLPGRRPGTAEGGERARPGRVLVFFVHFSHAHIRSGI